MKITVAINTCAASANPGVRNCKSSFKQGRSTYGDRANKLFQALLEYAADAPDTELLVVGEWYEHPAWTYIHDAGKLHNPIDPLQQRQTAAEAVSGDFIIFLNDDHFVKPEQLPLIAEYANTADVLAFNRRWKREEVEGPLETGWPGYIMGHACGMSKDALSAVPWSAVPKNANWDVEHSKLLRAAGVCIKYCDDVIAWDLEMGELP